MNWLLLVVVLFVGYHVFDGIRRGFIRKAVSAVSLVLTLVLVTCLTPAITNFIMEKTPLYGNLQEKCSELLGDDGYDENTRTDQVLMIENMELPESIKALLLENNNREVYEILGVSAFREYVSAYLAKMILHTLTYVISFVLVWTAIRLILLALDVVTMLPILHGLNKLAGGVLGLIFGVTLVWIAFLLLTIFCSEDVGRIFFTRISESPLLLFLYDQNPIMKIVYGLIF